ncbi:MAG: Na(+)/H(+) antiporter subunit B [Chloroflexi bacterium]|nr:Na(+)/H(+) antiporter subunit B [Chloroflexota bacterium]MBM4452007.1 Na(+)/H(+) antiporter subunit B [Chloroflexota bacterium]MBM4453483.1 Na(+)/H(+) antiporter subunit B [Chloroflexota bacterium]
MTRLARLLSSLQQGLPASYCSGGVSEMIAKYKDLIVSLACRLMAPFVFLFGLYVTMFGHYGPGGGFQGGTIMASGVILMRLSLGRQATIKKFPLEFGPIVGAIGLLIYAGTGLVSLLAGGEYLDYAYLPIPSTSGTERQYLGILFVEVGVALGVFGVLLSIFDSLTKE